MKKGRFGGPFFACDFMLLPKVSFGLLKVGAVSGLTASLWRAERCVRLCGCGLVLFALVVAAVEGSGLPVRQ